MKHLLPVLCALVTATGCLSNEYRISNHELRRLAQLPPGQRGQSIRVVQKVGGRRADPVVASPWVGAPPQPAMVYAPVDPGLPQGQGQGQVQGQVEYGAYPAEEMPGTVVVGPDVYVDVVVPVHVGGPVGPGPSVGSATSSGSPSQGFSGGGPSGAAPRTGVASPAGAAAPAGTPSGGRAKYAMPASGNGSGGSGSGDLSGIDDLRVLAVVVVAVAAGAAVGLAATEGSRYDGHVAAAGEQYVYLEGNDRQLRPVPLDQISPDAAAFTREAIIKDDEGYGLRRLGRRPLDRKGFAFKVEVGSGQVGVDRYLSSGFASNIQLGYFPVHNVGLLGTLALGFGTDDLTRKDFFHDFVGGEVQAFLPGLSVFHLGGFANAGNSFVTSESGFEQSRLAVGGGGLFEIAFTTRFALSLRAGWSFARPEQGDGWDSHGFAVTGGVSVY